MEFFSLLSQQRRLESLRGRPPVILANRPPGAITSITRRILPTGHPDAASHLADERVNGQPPRPITLCMMREGGRNAVNDDRSYRTTPL